MQYPKFIQQLRSYSYVKRIGQWLTPARRRLFWHTITIISLILVTVGIAYTWQELPRSDIDINPVYIVVAFIIYISAYITHLFGWHMLATLTFGKLPFSNNVEAIAASDLVKYLPTVAWYIANRVHYYDQKNVRRGSVVAASLLEMVMLLGSGAIIYLTLWLRRVNSLPLLLITLLILAISIKLGGSKLLHWWHTRITSYQTTADNKLRYWIIAFFLYGISWFMGALILTATLRTFIFVSMLDYLPLLNIWLIAGLVGTIISITVGTLGFAREATLTVLLAQYWPLSASIATAVSIKIILTAGQVVSALIILGWLRLIRKVQH